MKSKQSYTLKRGRDTVGIGNLLEDGKIICTIYEHLTPKTVILLFPINKEEQTETGEGKVVRD